MSVSWPEWFRDQWLLEQVVFDYFAEHSQNPKHDTKNLLKILRQYKRRSPTGDDLTDILAFMDITKWIEIFPGDDKKELRNTLRAIQKLFTDRYAAQRPNPYKIRYGKGDVSTDASMAQANPYEVPMLHDVRPRLSWR